VLPAHDNGQDQSCECLRFSAIVTMLLPINTNTQKLSFPVKCIWAGHAFTGLKATLVLTPDPSCFRAHIARTSSHLGSC
jgi:hypothetical protein